jgi:hypothetical protein
MAVVNAVVWLAMHHQSNATRIFSLLNKIPNVLFEIGCVPYVAYMLQNFLASHTPHHEW